MNEIKGKCTICGTAIDGDEAFCRICSELEQKDYLSPGYDYDEWEDDEDWDLIEDYDEWGDNVDYDEEDERCSQPFDPEIELHLGRLNLQQLLSVQEHVLALIAEKVKPLLNPPAASWDVDVSDIPF